MTAEQRRTHRCDETCVCPVHGTPLVRWPAGDGHACQDPACVHGHGMNDWADDIASLYILQDSLIEMPTELPSVRAERGQMYRESGQITRELIARLLAGEFR